jgi:capsid protein
MATSGGVQQRGESVTETLGDGSARTIQGIAPGMEIYARPGEEIEGFSPNVPNAEFFQHALMILSIIAVNIGIPVAVLLLDPTKTNFSGWRGAIDQARVGFKEMQRWMIQRFFSPVYRWKVRQWLAQDETLQALVKKGGVDPFAHEFLRPKWAYIEPMKDAQADDLRLSRNLTSPRRLFADRGEDWEQVADEIVEDKAYLFRAAISTAQKINKAFPEAKLDWRELCGTERPTSEAGDEEEATTEEPATKPQSHEATKG